MIYKKHFFLVLCLLTVSLQGRQIIEGDQQGQTSFSFSLGPVAFTPSNGLCVVGSSEEKEHNEYALAFASRSNKRFLPFAIPQIELDGKEDQPNPLTGAALSSVTLMQGGGTDVWPLVCLHKEPNRLYILQTYATHLDRAKKEVKVTKVNVISSGAVPDAQNQPSLQILGVGAKYPYILLPVSSTLVPLDQGFDLALAYFYYGVREEAKKEAAKLEKLNKKKKLELVAQGAEEPPVKKGEGAELIRKALKTSKISFTDVTTGLKDVKAIAVRRDHPAIARGGVAHSFLHTRIPVEWSEMMNAWYIPLHVQAGFEKNEGVCALLVAHYDEKTGLDIRPFLPASAVTSDSIVAMTQPGGTVGIFHTASLATTTWLPYLVVVGGTDNSCKRQVSALPVVGGLDWKTRGTLAKKNQTPVFEFREDELLSRTFLEPALKPEDVPTVDDAAVLVGGGLAPGDVTQLSVSGDAVFIAVDASQKTRGGIYHSQALFDGNGSIVGWTAWQRAAGITQPVSYFALDAVGGGDYWYAPKNQDQRSTEVMHTEWKSKSSDNTLEHTLTELFKNIPSGIQDLKSYTYSDDGMSKAEGSRASFLIATGYEHVVLIQSGSDSEGSFEPTKHFGDTQLFADGSLKGFETGHQVLDISGGVLAELGPIVSSAFIKDADNIWLAVAGTGGVAILARPDGTGIPADEGLGCCFKGLQSDMRFFKIGSFKNAYSLLPCKNLLYIVTPTFLLEYPVSSNTIKEIVKCNVRAIAKNGLFEGHSYFLDAWASPKYLFIGTDKGLMYHPLEPFCTNEGCQASWKNVTIPYGAGAVSRLYPIRASKHESGIFNLYVLSTSVSKDQTRVYRYILDESGKEPLIDLLPDVLLKTAGKAYFINLGIYRNHFATDGALAFFTGSIFGSRSPAVDTCLIDTLTRRRTFADGAQTVLKIADGSSIGAVLREPASGDLIAWGSFGARLTS